MVAQLETGTTFARYRIDGVAGVGGMGVVYHAMGLDLQRPVALKLISEEFAGDRGLRERFKRESQLAASIDHPNVIPIYEAGEVDGDLFIAMRYVEGTDLKKLVEADGALEPDRAVRIVTQVAAALDAAHRRGLVHRDVKPGNVLLVQNDEEHAYLSDFGLVKQLSDQAGHTTVGQFVGTLDYASPEQIEGKEATPRSDVYALGCVLFYTLTGTSPFARDSQVDMMYAHVHEPAPNLLDHAPNLPPALGAVLETALAKDPDDRQQSAGEFARFAQAAAHGESGSAVAGKPRLKGRTGAGALTPAKPTEPAQRAKVLGIVLPAVLVVGLAAALLAVFGVFGGGKDAEKPAPAGVQKADTATATPTAIAAPAAVQPKVAASVEVGKGPDGVSVIGGTVFVSNATDGTLTRIDPATNKPKGEAIEIGVQPDGIAGEKKVAWVASSGDARVKRVESNPDPVVVGNIPVGKAPEGISLGKQLVWVANGGDDTVNRIDRASATVVGSPIGVGKRPLGVFVGPNGVWITNNGDGTVTHIDSSTAEVVGEAIPVGKGPRGVVEGLGSVWVANSADGTVTRIDPKTAKPVGQAIRVGRNPRELTVGGGFVWVANAGDNTVSQIDPKTGRVVGRAIPVGTDPIGIAFGAGSLWTANHRDDTVTRIKL